MPKLTWMKTIEAVSEPGGSMTRETWTREQNRDFLRQTAAEYAAEDVGAYLDGMADDLEAIMYRVELLKDRPDISDEDRRTAQYIYTGLEAWTELIYDATEETE